MRAVWAAAGVLFLAGGLVAQDPGDPPSDFPYRLKGFLGSTVLLEEVHSGQASSHQIGEEVDGYRLARISGGAVLLEKEGRTYELRPTPRGTPAGQAEEEDAYPWALPAWSEEIRRRLSETRVLLDYRDAPLERVLEDIQEKSGVAIRISPRVFLDLPRERLLVSLSAGPMSATDALGVVLAGPGLAYSLEAGAVRVEVRAEPRKEDEASRVQLGLARARAIAAARAADGVAGNRRAAREKVFDALEREVVPASAAGRPFVEVVPDLFTAAGADLSISPEVRERIAQASLPPETAGQPLGEGVRKFLEPLGLDFEVAGASVRIASREDVLAWRNAAGESPGGELARRARERAVRAAAFVAPAGPTPARELAKAFGEAAGVSVYPGPEIWVPNRALSVRGETLTVGAVLEALAAQYRIHGVVVDGDLYLVK
ncbi:MAG: hypothetical protein HY720_20335 [Planctomycetes bacterium]|nr:hypothetical protein [Planctomycetota bacterium]